MTHTLHFSASSSVKNLFGQGLVTDQIAAVFELVKNSYDADATEVDIIFSNSENKPYSLTISDNGTGMDINDIEDKWMVIGTDSKRSMMYSPIFNRALNGDKGIGRFSVDRLGSFLHMEAQKIETTQRYLMEFDWSVFEGKSRSISDIEIPYISQHSDPSNHGVSLTISQLRDRWDEVKIRDLYRNLRQFKSPFSQDDNFRIYITSHEIGYHKREVTVEKLENISSLWINAEVSVDNPESIYISVTKDGLEYETTQKNIYSFGSVKAKIFMFNQGDKVRFSNRYSMRVREYGNIRLYRDNFRVYPYGEAKNDWLDIDRRQAQGKMRFFGTRDLIGYVQISKTNNTNLKPLTSRQGLEENDSFEELRNFVIEICIKNLESYYFNKIKKSVNETIKVSKVEINNALENLGKLAGEINGSNPDAAKQIKSFTSEIKKYQEKQLEYVKDQQELVKVYKRIAQKETFLHKLIHQSMIHINDASVAIKAYIKKTGHVAIEEDKYLESAQEYIHDALTLLRTVRDDVVKKRSKSIQDISALTRKYILDNQAYFIESNVEVNVTSKGDLHYYIDPGDVKSILNNLATNAVKSLRQVTDRNRNLSFELYRTNQFAIIKCIDNGVGIKESDRERIFDPFQSTTDGFGLGLTIVDETVKEYAGTLELMETPIGACFIIKLRY